jgi:hypothetical protein
VIVGVHHRQAHAAVTADEHAALGLRVAGHVAVAMQVLVGQVGEDPDLGQKRRRRLELVAGRLAHDPAGLRLLGHRVGRLDQPVAGADDFIAGSPQTIGDQVGDGALAVRPGDPDHRRGAEPPAELELVDHRDSAPPRVDDDGVAHLQTGALDDATRGRIEVQGRLGSSDRDPDAEALEPVPRRSLGRGFVFGPYPDSAGACMLGEPLGSRAARPAKADDEERAAR